MSLKPAPESRLTPRQLQLLKAIRVFQAGRCYSPTIAELAQQLTISRSTTFEHIEELRKKDLLSPSPAAARSLKLTSKALKLLDRLDSDTADFRNCPSSDIPLAGRV